MEAKLYYTPPTDQQFKELKKEATKLWSTMGYTPDYSEGKIARIKNLVNSGDNFMYMVAMFDMSNQRNLAKRVSESTREAVRVRMIDGGTPLEYLTF